MRLPCRAVRGSWADSSGVGHTDHVVSRDGQRSVLCSDAVLTSGVQRAAAIDVHLHVPCSSCKRFDVVQEESMSTHDGRILSRRQVVAGAAGLGLVAPFVRFGALAAQDATPAAARRRPGRHPPRRPASRPDLARRTDAEPDRDLARRSSRSTRPDASQAGPLRRARTRRKLGHFRDGLTYTFHCGPACFFMTARR